MTQKIKNTHSKEAFRVLLRKTGYKATRARLALLLLMRQAKAPLNAQDLIQQLGRTADPVTTYRTLKNLKESGIIKQVDLRHNHAHYELVDINDHHHIICLQCGRIEDILGCDMEAIQQTVLKTTNHFAEIKQHSLEFYGICKKCIRGKN